MNAQRETITAVVALLFLGLAPSLCAAQQPRDARSGNPRDGAQIYGIVRTADRYAKPLRRARVTLTGGELTLGRTTITSDEGTFAFDRLPAGRYMLAAAKDGYVGIAFGAARPGRPGARIVVAPGERRSVTVSLTRGAVITGMLTSADGQALAGLTVMAMAHRFIPQIGEQRFIMTGASVTTDDRGVYRIYGLAAGDYVVMAQVRNPGLMGGQLEEISPAEVRRALAEVKDISRRTTPGPAPIAPPAGVASDPRRTVALAPAFYPGTGMIANARFVPLAPGEERGGIDFSVDYVPVARVQGFVSMPGVTQPAFVTIAPDVGVPVFEQNRSTRTSADGAFTLTGITPGTYRLMARAGRGSATTQITVNGNDIEGVTLTVSPGLTVAGRVVFEGANGQPLPVMPTRVALPIASATAEMVGIPDLQIQADGHFELTGIIPGSYRFLTNVVPGVRAPAGRWWLKSIAADGRELLDAPLQFLDDVHDIVITFTDRANELNGLVTRAAKDPAPDPYVVAFSVDRSRWFFNSRSVAAGKVAEDGRFSLRNLTPGEYFVAAATDLDTGEWFDPAVLEELARRGTRITIAADETKTLTVALVK